MSDVGVWLVGARGNIATTAMVGAKAIARGETDTTGMVSARRPVSRLDMPDVSDLAFGGHDIRTGSVPEDARRLAEENGMPHPSTVEAVADDLADVDDHVHVGTALNCGESVEALSNAELLEEDRTVAEIVERIRDDVDSFRRAEGLDRVVMVNVASSEPPVENPDDYATREAFESAVEGDDRDLPASSLYAYVALSEGHPYANFTPSAGSSLGGLRQLAREEGVPHMGNDGKTGESLVKAALGPMFAGRNLRVMSWEGHNILGNTDGQVLEDERNKAGKIESKGDILDGILDDDFHNRVRIDYTPSLDDWKTAWDYIHFEGFLDTEMKMQFTWEGSDSALAAPLALDLVRLLSNADERGESGLQTHLASFFKAPLDVDEHDLARQFTWLYDYVDRNAGEETPDGVTAETPTDD
ncbi:inositol-3-phosphate synthase [Halopelagius fulvigenes]|uniref:Inositol-3-phosphate synthase n=1 Tax=Halopelagius fulvigenes TaxID=1198324 RepID=A0ABD5TYM9_9EURY